MAGKNGVGLIGTFDNLITGIKDVLGIKAGVVVSPKTILDGIR